LSSNTLIIIVFTPWKFPTALIGKDNQRSIPLCFQHD
jgi:hypothetical protein